MKSHEKTPMPVQDPGVRGKNFDEVALGYTEEMAVAEASRCLNCKNKPCVSGCPVHVAIPDFIGAVADRRFDEAYRIVTETNSLPGVCGRVCPQESQCECQCVLGSKHDSVGIGNLERFVADWHREHVDAKPAKPKSNGTRVAVVGAGPSGLSCAYDLARWGYSVTIMEAFHQPGGVLVYGIPAFRLPKSIIKSEIEELEALGVRIMTNMVVGKSVDINELFQLGYHAVYIASGAGLPKFMHISGENLVGVYSANEYLTRINLMHGYREEYDTPVFHAKTIAVVGGGNVAMDAARCAKRTGAEKVYLVYRRSEEEMPARLEEIHHAKEEGVILKTLTNPVKIIGNRDGRVEKLECVEMALGEPDESGRRIPFMKENSSFEIDVDCVIMAIGTSPNPLVTKATEGLATNNRGCIIVDDLMRTSLPNVYAGGDAVKGAATVIYAMGTGKIAAKSIHDAISCASEHAV